MSTSTVVKKLPETSMWHGAISDEDVALVRRRHAEKVEEWLDFADFVTELNALHEKYGIEKGEEGYFAYRKHLRIGYYEKLQTYGPTPDPLDEGCDCIFCRMHTEDEPAQPEDCRVRCADQPGKKSDREDGPHSGPYESDIKSSASGECELPEATLKPQGTDVPRSPLPKSKPRRLGQVPAESPADDDGMNDQNDDHPRIKKKLGPVPAYASTDNNRKSGPHSGPYESDIRSSASGECELPEATSKPQGAHAPRSPAVNQETRIDQSRSTTGRVRCADQPALHAPQKNGPHSGPNEKDDHDSKKLGLVPAYFAQSGARTWMKKMSGAVF